MENLKFKEIIRYLLPGGVFFLEYFVLSLLVDFDNVIRFFDVNTKNNFFSLTVLIIISLFFGYIFSTTYHVFAHTCRYFKSKLTARLILDHRDILVLNEHYVDVVNKFNQPISWKNLSPADAWCFVTMYWNANLDSGNASNVVMSADKKTQELADWVHSAGAVLFANIFMIIVWLYKYDFSSMSNWHYKFLFLSLPAIHVLIYFFTLRDCERVINSLVMKSLYCDYVKRNHSPEKFFLD